MALTREQKATLIDEIGEQLEASSIIYLTNFTGLSVTEANDLRGRFFEADVRYRVVKNTLADRAMQGLGTYEELREHMSGPTAIAFSEEPAAPARVIKAFREETDAELPTLKVAYVDGAIYGADELDALAALKSRDELIGDIIGLLLAPIQNVVGSIQAPGRNLAGALQSIAVQE